jgi:protocatechuate 3,4-dioxygenase, alpha subunit
MSEPPLGTTPSQTVGPYLAIVLPWADGPQVAAPGSAGLLTISGRLTDGAGEPVPDGLVEVWQAGPDGRIDHPDDPRGAARRAGFRGFGRCPTGGDGGFAFHTVKPGPLPAGDGRVEAPHLDVSVFARGLLRRLVTRIYFPDEVAANAADPVLAGLQPWERRLLTAVPLGAGGLRFDIRLQGDDETPFFEV